jgi:hypothetical protein
MFTQMVKILYHYKCVKSLKKALRTVVNFFNYRVKNTFPMLIYQRKLR